MDGAVVKLGQGHYGQGHGLQGQDVIPPLNDNFSHVFNIHLIKDEILKYLYGSALIQLGSVTRGIRQLVTSSSQYKKKVNLKVKTMEFFIGGEPLPGWVSNMKNLTLTMNYDVGSGFNSLKFLSLARTLPNLSTLVVVNESFSYYSLNKILKLSSQLKSLSLPYNLMLDQIDFDHVQNLEELKLTTSNYKVKLNENFEENLNTLSMTCINLKSFTCQEFAQVEGRYVKDIEEEDHEFFNGLLTIIENNSKSLEKLEFGISQLVVGNSNFSSKLAKISLPNLKFLDLRAVRPELGISVLRILKNLPQPGQLTTLKLSFIKFPVRLFRLIRTKFPQLKSLSLKASKYNSGPGIPLVLNENRWSFLLKSLTQLEELEITRFITDVNDSDFGQEISENFPRFLLNQKNNLRKLSLKGMNCLSASKFFKNGVTKMLKLKELKLTGFCFTLDDFMTICTHLKILEKLEISHLHPDRLNPHFTGREIDYREILTAFSSLKYLKEVSLEVWSGDFQKVLGSISFPYLKTINFCNANLKKDEIENLFGLNVMLKEVSIVSLKYGYEVEDPDDDDKIEIANEINFKVGFSSKQVEICPSGRQAILEDFDPDSKPLSEQNIIWPDSQTVGSNNN